MATTGRHAQAPGARARGLLAPRVPVLRAAGRCSSRAASTSASSTTRRSRSGRSPGGCTRSTTAHNPLVTHRRLGAERGRPRLGEHGAGAVGGVRPADGAARPGRLVRHRRGGAAGRLGLGRVPALPPPDRALLALARRRLPVRLLELRARARARPAAADGGVRGAARRARGRPAPRGRSSTRGASSSSSGLLLALQVYLATEIALHADDLARPRARRRLSCSRRRDARRSGTCSGPPWRAYLVAAVLAAPILYYALTDLRVAGFQPPEAYTADLLNLVMPTHLEAARCGLGPLDRAALPREQHRAGRAHRAPAPRDRRALCPQRPGGRRSGASCSPRSPSRRTCLIRPEAVRSTATRRSPCRRCSATRRSRCRGSAQVLPLFDNILPVRFALYASLAGGRDRRALDGVDAAPACCAGSYPGSPCCCSSRTPAPASGRRRSRCRRSSRAPRTEPASHTERDRPAGADRKRRPGDALAGRERVPLPDGRRPAPDLAAERVPSSTRDRADLRRLPARAQPGAAPPRATSAPRR